MKFKFLGDGECPDWLLIGINTLSSMPCPYMIKIIEECVTVITSNSNSKQEQSSMESILKSYAKNLHLDINNLKGVVAAVDFILKSAIRNDVKPSELESELLQLGSGISHSKAFSRVYDKHIKELNAYSSKQFLRLNKLPSVEVIPVDNKSPVAKINLKVITLNDEEESRTINITKDSIPILLGELKKARSLMENLKK